MTTLGTIKLMSFIFVLFSSEYCVADPPAMFCLNPKSRTLKKSRQHNRFRKVVFFVPLDFYIFFKNSSEATEERGIRSKIGRRPSLT